MLEKPWIDTMMYVQINIMNGMDVDGSAVTDLHRHLICDICAISDMAPTMDAPTQDECLWSYIYCPIVRLMNAVLKV